jgi:hypothetical protein
MQPATGRRNRGAKAILFSALLVGSIILLSRQWRAPSAVTSRNSQTQSNKTVAPGAAGDSRLFANEAVSAPPDFPQTVPSQKPNQSQESTGDLQARILKNPVPKRSGLPPALSGDSEMSERQIRGLTFEGSAPQHEDLLRRAWRAGEGKFYDRKLFLQSIEQLNQLGLYEPVSEDDCEVIMRPDGHIHIRVRVRALGSSNR